MNVLLEAFVDVNLGDDLMLDLLIHRYPHAQFFCIGPEQLNFSPPYSNWDNFFVINRHFWNKFLDRFDAYLNVGGSVWQDYGNNQEWYEVRRITVERMRQQGKPRLMIGNNIGPITTQKGREHFSEIMRNLTEITFRDRKSYDWGAEFLPEGQIRLTADVVLAKAFDKGKIDPDLIGITVHRDTINAENNQLFVEQVAKLVEILLSRDEKTRVVLFAFDTGPIQNDLLNVNAILAKLDDSARERTGSSSYEGDINQFVGSLSGCGRILASHFHAIILALLLKMPFVPFAYQNKTMDFLADLGYTGQIVDYGNITECLNDIATQLFSNERHYSQKSLKELIVASQSNFLRGDEVFAKSSEKNKGNLDLVLMMNQISETNGSLETVLGHTKADLEETKRQLSDAREVAQQFLSQLEDARSVSVENERQLNDARGVVEDFERQLSDARGIAETLASQLVDARGVAESLTSQYTDAMTGLAQYEQQLQDLNSLVEKYKEEVEIQGSENNLLNSQLADLVLAGEYRRQEIINQSYEISLLHTEIFSLKQSFSWKITRPFRLMKWVFKKVLRRG